MDKINSAGDVLDRLSLVKLFQANIYPMKLECDIAKSVLQMEDTCQHLELNSKSSCVDINKPYLSEPKIKLNNHISFMEIFTSIRKILGKDNINNIQRQLQRLKTESESLNQQGVELLSHFEYCTESLQQKASAMTGYKESYHDIQQSLSEKRQALGLSKEKLALNTDNLGDEYRAFLLSEQMQLVSELEVLEKELLHADRVLQNAYKEMTTLAIKADTARTNLNQFMENAGTFTEVDGEKWVNNLSLLTMLTAQLKKMINDDSLRSLKEQEVVIEQISEASRKDSECKAQEAEEAQRKADDVSKSASCASKTLSYVLLTVSVVATVASFGSAAPLTIALAALGIAISVTDIVLEETGQGSLMQKMAEVISKPLAKILVSCGVEEELAKNIADIISIVISAVAFITIGFISNSSLVKNIQNTTVNVIKKIADRTKNIIQSIIKALPSTFFTGLSKLGSSINKSSYLTTLNKLSERKSKLEDVVNTATQFIQKSVGSVDSQKKLVDKIELGAKAAGIVISTANVATSGSLNLYSASKLQDLKIALASISLNSDTIRTLDELIESFIKMLSQRFEKIDEIFIGMLSSLHQSNQRKANLINLGNFA